MRKPLILAAILAATPIGQALAQPAATPTPRLQLNADQRAQLQQAVARGRALAVIDNAARITTRDMLTRVPNPREAGIAGWIAQVEGNAVAVTYFARESEGFSAVYKAQVLGGRVTSPQVFAAGSRPALTGDAARMAAARIAAGAVEKQPCGPEFNAVVLPPEGAGPILVYRLSPLTAPNKLPGGGHYRVAVAADGSIAEETSLGTATCTDIAVPAPAAAGGRPAPLRINAAGSEWPSEIHVFMAVATGRPAVVATGTGPIRLWGVSRDGIGELQQ
jgi:hypothetical protein